MIRINTTMHAPCDFIVINGMMPLKCRVIESQIKSSVETIKQLVKRDA